MNLKTFLSATIALVGTYYLGFPLLVCILAFNAIFWCEIVYDLVTFKKEEVLEEETEETESLSADPMQIEFDRFLIRKFMELEALENEILNNEIPIVHHRPMGLAEA